MSGGIAGEGVGLMVPDALLGNYFCELSPETRRECTQCIYQHLLSQIIPQHVDSVPCASSSTLLHVHTISFSVLGSLDQKTKHMIADMSSDPAVQLFLVN